MQTSGHTDRIERTGHDQPGGRAIAAVRRLALFGGAVGAAITMWIHPHAGEKAYESLSPVASTFVSAHLLLLASLAVLALGLYLLSTPYGGRLATVSRAGLAVFSFFYLGYVAIVGLAKGLLIREAQSLPAGQQTGVAAVVEFLHTEPWLFGAGALGAVGLLLAVSALAAVLYRDGAPRAAIVLLFGVIVAIGSHSGVLAVAGMAGFVIAAGWLEFGWARSASSEATG